MIWSEGKVDDETIFNMISQDDKSCLIVQVWNDGRGLYSASVNQSFLAQDTTKEKALFEAVSYVRRFGGLI